MQETNNMLSFLDNYTLDNPDEIAKEIANDFRKRRIEKNLTDRKSTRLNSSHAR